LWASGTTNHNVGGVVAAVSEPECQRLNSGWVRYRNNTKHPVQVNIDGVNCGIVPVNEEKRFGPFSAGLRDGDCLQPKASF